MSYATLPAREQRHHRDPRAFNRVQAQHPAFRVTVGTSEIPPWVKQVGQQLQELHELGPNWTGYRASPVQDRLIETAFSDVLAAVMPDGGAVPQVVPRADGGLQIEWHHGGWDIEVTLDPLGEIWVDASSVDGDEEWDGDFTSRQDDLKALLQEIA